MAPDVPNSSTTPKPPSPHIGFYKMFGRPVAKVFFGAVFVYQGVYWMWLKFETEDLNLNKQKKIKDLESEIRTLAQRSPSTP